MKNHLIIILIFFCLLACQEKNKSQISKNVESGDNIDLSPLSWKNIKSKFPNSEIVEYDFSGNGQPLNEIRNLPRLDSITFRELSAQIKQLNDWKEYLEIYYFSKNIIEENEIGIFLSIREFDGTNYNFDAIQIDELGKVLKIQNLANSWQAAECIGYTRTQLDYKNRKMTSQKLRKCYDEEAENNKSIDSLTIETSLKELDFKVIEYD